MQNDDSVDILCQCIKEQHDFRELNLDNASISDSTAKKLIEAFN